MSRRIGTIQVDLDGLWTNLEYYGQAVNTSPDPVFMSSIPRFLELFEQFDIKATFFAIGRDMEVKEKAKLIRDIAKAGHELANHTYSHPFGFKTLSTAEKMSEIVRGENAIERVIGKKPLGFKSPGYDVDSKILNILSERGYLYDSSVIPTFVYPLLMRVNRIVHGGVKRTHGPKWNWVLAPNRMYHPSIHSAIKKGNLQVTELPCTVTPFFRLPFHATFVNKLGLNYFKFNYYASKMGKVHFNYEFHAVDLADEDKRLGHVSLSLNKRIKLFKEVLKIITNDYLLTTSGDFIKRIKEKKKS